MGIPALRTERLLLREPDSADAPAVLVFRGDPRVQRFNDEPLTDVAAAEAFIRFLRADSASDARRHWAITADDEVVGLIGLHTNHRSVRLLERLGFRREGTLREYSLEDDQRFHDSAVYGLLATEG
jgi:ribosomal-protein-alanine N-acetyltransferase